MTTPITAPNAASARGDLTVTHAAGFTPASIAGLQAWWDASNAGSITASAGAVSQWNDLSGNGRHLVQGTGSRQLVTGADTQNGKNVMTCGGTTGTRMATAAGFTLAQPFTVIFAVYVIDPQPVTYSHLLNSNADTVQCYVTSSGNPVAQTMYAGTELKPAAAAFSGPQLVFFTFNGASSSVRVNGGARTASGAAGSTGLSGVLTLLGYSTDGFSFKGRAFEMLVYNSAIAGTNLTNLETYFNPKWAIY